MTAPVLRLSGFSCGIGERTIVKNLSFEIRAGETLALIGESGAGKSLTALAMIGLMPPGGWSRGHMEIDGNPVNPMDQRVMAGLRGSTLGLVFQDASQALDPGMRIGSQIIETLRRHRDMNRHSARDEAEHLLDRLGFVGSGERLERYPHELSGGMRQRVMIALALAAEPKLLIADEPTSALDAPLRRDILMLLRREAKARQQALLLISHDLDHATAVAERLCILYAGRMMETGFAARLERAPQHPYTQALFRARLNLSTLPQTQLETLSGSPPHGSTLPEGCPFHPRCPVSEARCVCAIPPWQGQEDSGFACVRGGT